MAHEHGDPIDSIIFAEVMFDKKNGISGESPRHIDFVKNKAKPLFESWGYKVYILHAEKDYLDIFHGIIDKPRKNMENKGKKRGFPMSGTCWAQRDCKVKPINEFRKNIGDEIIEYIGIAIDEPKRLSLMHERGNQVSLMEKYGLTEQMAYELCAKYGLLSPSYEKSSRNGCWFCPNAKLREHKEIRSIMPDAWKRYVELENESDLVYKRWNIYSDETLHERDENLMWEIRQMTIEDYLNIGGKIANGIDK